MRRWEHQRRHLGGDLGVGARSWCACGCAGLAPQLTWASGYLPPRTLAPGPVGTSLFTLNARCDWGGREDLVKVLGEQGPGVVVIVGAPERVREHLDESRVLDGQPHRAFFPMGHLTSCGTVVYARVPVKEVADSPLPAVRLVGRRRAPGW